MSSSNVNQYLYGMASAVPGSSSSDVFVSKVALVLEIVAASSTAPIVWTANVTDRSGLLPNP